MTDHSEKNQRIKEFANRYKVTLNRIVSELFWGDPKKQTGGILKDRIGLHLHSRALPGSLSFATPDTEYTALDENLAILFWAKAGKQKRIRCTTSELRSIVDVSEAEPFVHGARHCICSSNDKFGNRPRVFRAYLTKTYDAKTIEQVTNIVDGLYQIPSLVPLIKSRSYGVLVLCERPHKQVEVARAISRSRVSKKALIEVAIGPTADTIAEALRKEWWKHND